MKIYYKYTAEIITQIPIKHGQAIPHDFNILLPKNIYIIQYSQL